MNDVKHIPSQNERILDYMRTHGGITQMEAIKSIGVMRLASRISDLRIAAGVLKGHHLAEGVRGIVSPATPKIYKMAVEEGLINIFLEAGFCVTNPTCGACLGMSNGVLAEGEVCASTTNRNFNGRMGKGGMVHLMSPATAAATAIAGTIVNSELYKG